MSAADRDAYVREVSAVAAPGAQLLIVAFIPGASMGVPGIGFEEVQRRFKDGWTLPSGDEPAMDQNGTNRARALPVRTFDIGTGTVAVERPTRFDSRQDPGSHALR